MARSSRRAGRAGITLWVLGDQLTTSSNLFRDADPRCDRVLMIESSRRCGTLPYHKKKLVFVWSAMRHFASELEAEGWKVDYRREETGYARALADHIARQAPPSVRIMKTSEAGREKLLAKLVEQMGAASEIVANDLFITATDEFARFATGRKSLRMEDFYRLARTRTGLLMDGSEPVGGKWNFDVDNRKRPPSAMRFPAPPQYPADAITAEVIAAVNRLFATHPGGTEGFALPVTRAQAGAALADFLRNRLDLFGPYQDAIVRGERTLYHSVLSPLLNVGLLDPLSVCRGAERAYTSGHARLQSTEGFIRQILGWREFVRHVYAYEMPSYLNRNALGAKQPLPGLYWTADTKMECMRDAVTAVIDDGANHHIQRLMVTGNFALLAGISPREILDWYWAMYVDAFEWVVAPNVLGMALYADGGTLATKPYAAAANYINKMSDCCRACTYDPKTRTENNSCPFNALYWDFLQRNRATLGANQRLRMPYASLARMSRSKTRAITERARAVRAALLTAGKI